MDVLERSYRTAVSLRQLDMREQRKIQVLFNGRRGPGAAHRTELASMDKQKRILRQDLARIQKSTATISGCLPPRVGEVNDDIAAHKTSMVAVERQRRPTVFRNTEATASKKKAASFRLCEPPRTPENPHLIMKRRRSLQHILYENQKAEDAFKRFNESFPAPETDNEEQENDEVTKPDGIERENVITTTSLKPKTRNILLTPRSDNKSVTPRNGDLSDGGLETLDINDARDNVTKRLLTKDGKPFSPAPFLVTPRDAPRMLAPISNEQIIGNKKVSFTDKDHPSELVQDAPTSAPTEENNEERSAKARFTLPKKKKKKRDDAPSIPQYDTNLYNPDGSLRTLHNLPTFEDSLKEAQRARYIRHKQKPNFEKELTVSDIFKKLKPVTKQ